MCEGRKIPRASKGEAAAGKEASLFSHLAKNGQLRGGRRASDRASKSDRAARAC